MFFFFAIWKHNYKFWRHSSKQNIKRWLSWWPLKVQKITIQILVNLTMAFSRYEKVIDLGFGKCHILSSSWVRLPIFEILKSHIMKWGVGDNFLKMLVEKGVSGFWKSKTWWAYMHIPNLILSAKEIFAPH
jgi:hypothetical protein